MNEDPVLLCTDLGTETESGAIQSESSTSPPDRFRPSGTVKSIKEAVRIAQSNNFFGLMCRSRLLSMVPALIDAIKVAGLVLVSDDSGSVNTASYNTEGIPKHQSISDPLMTGNGTDRGITPAPNGIDGVLGDKGVLKFCQSVDA